MYTSEKDKICCFDQDSPPFLSILSIVFTGSLLRWGCRLGLWQSYCRCSEWPPPEAAM